MTTPPTSAAAVANAFLDLQDRDASVFPRIDQMKLQKLVYYAQAWWLAIKGAPLFQEGIFAWPWGPVVPSIYGDFREFGRAPIVGKRATIYSSSTSSNGGFNFEVTNPPPPEGEVSEFLAQIWRIHKNMTGVQLSNATHADGEPWTILKESFGSLDGKPQIPNELMQAVFRKKIKAA